MDAELYQPLAGPDLDADFSGRTHLLVSWSLKAANNPSLDNLASPCFLLPPSFSSGPILHNKSRNGSQKSSHTMGSKPHAVRSGRSEENLSER